MKLITNWLNSFDYSKNELEQLAMERLSDDIVVDNFDEEKARTFSMIPFNSFKYNHLTVDTCATNIINNLFDKYVDDDTSYIPPSLNSETCNKYIESILFSYDVTASVSRCNDWNYTGFSVGEIEVSLSGLSS